MFAIIKTGGKQYRVAENDIVKVERLPGSAGDRIVLSDVLMVEEGGTLKVGSPLLSGIAVSAEILEQTRGDKIIIFKKKRRQNYRRKRGHRQDLTVLRILGIGEAKAEAPKAKKAAEKTDEAGAKAEAPKKAAPKKAAAKADAAPATSKKPASRKSAKPAADKA